MHYTSFSSVGNTLHTHSSAGKYTHTHYTLCMHCTQFQVLVIIHYIHNACAAHQFQVQVNIHLYFIHCMHYTSISSVGNLYT